jgi:hypothetical protein
MRNLIYLLALVSFGAFAQQSNSNNDVEPISIVEKSPLNLESRALSNGLTAGSFMGANGRLSLSDGSVEGSLDYGLLAGYFKNQRIFLLEPTFKLTGADKDKVRFYGVVTPLRLNHNAIMQEKSFGVGGWGAGVESHKFSAQAKYRQSSFYDLVNTGLLDDEGAQLNLLKSSFDVELQKTLGKRFIVIGSMELGKVMPENKTMEESVYNHVKDNSKYSKFEAKVKFKAAERLTIIAVYHNEKFNYLTGAVNDTEFIIDKSQLQEYKAGNNYFGLGVSVNLSN